MSLMTSRGQSRECPNFATTRWSKILAARQKSSSEAEKALEYLCHAYWYPLYAYVRRCGHSHEDAEDSTQRFFTRLLKHNFIAGVSPAKGRFRTFLLCCMQNQLADEKDYREAYKRDIRKTVSLDCELAEARYHHEFTSNLSPDKFFNRLWALELLNNATRRLGEEYAKAGESAKFELLRGCLAGQRGEVFYAELAPRLNISKESARVTVSRFRQKFRELFKDEVANTVSTSEEFQDEMQHMQQLWSE